MFFVRKFFATNFLGPDPQFGNFLLYDFIKVSFHKSTINYNWNVLYVLYLYSLRGKHPKLNWKLKFFSLERAISGDIFTEEFFFFNNILPTPDVQYTNIFAFENAFDSGGLPDLSRMPPGSTAGLPVPFTGCIRRLSIDYDTIPLNYSSIAACRNIADCDGTPCGGDLCHHGGSCWLDMDMKPHCHCLQVHYTFILPTNWLIYFVHCVIVKEFTGESCNKQVPCTEFKCQNKGHCVSENGNTSFVCKCPPGWDGPFCSKGMFYNVVGILITHWLYLN